MIGRVLCYQPKPEVDNTNYSVVIVLLGINL